MIITSTVNCLTNKIVFNISSVMTKQVDSEVGNLLLVRLFKPTIQV